MDSAFSHDGNYRANFVRFLMQSVGCTYVCLWKYNPENYVFFYLDGLYYEDLNTQLPSSSSSSSSSRSLARTLFDEYCQSIILGVSANDQVPGSAFRNNSPYLELQDIELRRLASNDSQRRFYVEAGIRTAVFMGCRTGEIEIGLPIEPQMKMKMDLRNWFPEEFSSQSQVAGRDQVDRQIIISSQTQIVEQLNNPIIIKPPTDTTSNQNPLAAASSSNSSSLRSLSMDTNSPEYSSLLFSINNNPTPSTTTTNTTSSQILSIINNNPNNSQLLLQPCTTTTTTTSTTTPPPLLTMPHQQAMQAFASLRQAQFPSSESEDAAMTKAILAVLTSNSPDPTSSSSSSLYSSDHHHHHHHGQLINQKSSAFKSYSTTTHHVHHHHHPHPRLSDLNKNMFKRSVSFFRSLNFMRTRQRLQEAAANAAAAGNTGTTCRPTTSTQLHHMISERKRREKLNESFQSLRSLLPPGTKKDKASVLNSTTDYLNSLKAQVEELSKRNKELEAQVLSAAIIRSTSDDNNIINNNKNVPLLIIDSSSTTTTADHDGDDQTRRVNVRIRHVSESTSEEAQIVDLQLMITQQRANNSINVQVEDFVLRIMEFLKSVNHVSLMSMEANTQLTQSNSTTSSLHRLTLRLRIEGSEWEESTFEEAVRRVVADLAAQ
ncbi:hypothetical protein F8388_002017 [Cannabis sativa]|uniref:BHLH domain-containing protein n=1 Tax=Cannabis sativa TaxID=3483 RepID=A0A7J6H9C0_CANSA|nr:hypothetical protein F8388_002017 [Cannabis sativa]KAF4391876.1 hypothetical protein G4B88_007451 [Cannabis sativa]